MSYEKATMNKATCEPSSFRQELLIEMKRIIEAHPLAFEYETDARAVWPKRWEELQKFIELMS